MGTRLSRPRALVVAVAAGLLLLAAPAHAIPDDGASADTPGTHASLTKRTLPRGGTIAFTVSGFPPGEVLNVKIDDGRFCSAKAVHGACVVHQQRIGRNGQVKGSFALPADLKPGRHWLRFLSSEEITDASGKVLGSKGFTLRGGADFTVVKKGAAR